MTVALAPPPTHPPLASPGLVAITPACATVDSWFSLLIGILASLVVRAASSVVARFGYGLARWRLPMQLQLCDACDAPLRPCLVCGPASTTLSTPSRSTLRVACWVACAQPS